jgi:hypothetical protein
METGSRRKARSPGPTAKAGTAKMCAAEAHSAAADPSATAEMAATATAEVAAAATAEVAATATAMTSASAARTSSSCISGARQNGR